MEVIKVLKRGYNHKLSCEDYLVHFEWSQYTISAVFDGCSSGKESFFASSLLGKALKSIDIEKCIYYISQQDIFDVKINEKTLARVFLNELIKKIRKIKDILNLDEIELLSTVILNIVDTVKETAYAFMIGDGSIFVKSNNNDFTLDTIEPENNAPNYLGYDTNLFKYNENNFSNLSFFNEYEYSDVSEITISTDGIDSFTQQDKSKECINVVDFLIKDKKFVGQQKMLYKKLNILQKHHSQSNFDDLAMIRIIL